MRWADRSAGLPPRGASVGGAFLCHLLVFGLTYTFGILFVDVRRDLGAGSAAVGAVPGLASAVVLAGSALAGRLARRWGVPVVVGAGAVAVAAGLLLSSYATQVWQLALCFGLLFGLGGSCCFVPSLMAVATVSGRRKALSLGVAGSGASIGMILLAPLATALLTEIGWRVWLRVMAAVSLAGLLAGAALFRSAAPDGPRPEGSAPVLAGRRFLAYYAAVLLVGLGYYVPFVHLAPYAAGAGRDAAYAAVLLVVLGVANIVGRVALGALGDLADRYLVLTGSVALAALSLALAGRSDPGTLVVATAGFGTAAGAIVALTPAVADDLFPSVPAGTLTGPVYTALAVGAVLGPVLGGLCADHGRYGSAFVGAAVTMAAATAVLLGPLRPAGARPGQHLRA